MCGLTAPPWDCAARRWSTLQNNGRTGRPGAGIPRGGGGGGSHRRPPVRSGASGNSCRGASCNSSACLLFDGRGGRAASPNPDGAAAAAPDSTDGVLRWKGRLDSLEELMLLLMFSIVATAATTTTTPPPPPSAPLLTAHGNSIQ